MTKVTLTLWKALAQHLADNGFPVDGGLHDIWAVILVAIDAGRRRFTVPGVRSKAMMVT